MNTAKIDPREPKGTMAQRLSCLPFLGLLVFVGGLQAQDLDFPIPTARPKSSESRFTSRIGGTTPGMGKPFSFRIAPEGGRLLSIQVCLSPLPPIVVHALRLSFIDKQKTPFVRDTGNCQGKWLKPFIVPANRHLTGISGSSGWLVDTVRFHLDDNSTSELYGGHGGETEVSVQIKKDSNGKFRGELRGIWGTRIDGRLESLGLILSTGE